MGLELKQLLTGFVQQKRNRTEVFQEGELDSLAYIGLVEMDWDGVKKNELKAEQVDRKILIRYLFDV